MRVLGIDLSANETNASAIATYEDGKIRTFTMYKDKDLMDIISKFKPEVIAIDAPLHTVEKPFRAAEKEIQHLGYHLLPLNMPGMRALAKRASSIRYALEGTTKVIECHPASTRKVLGIEDPRKLKNVRFLNIIKNKHEEDAIFAALTAVFYSEGNYGQFGDEEEGYIILPKV